jgi:hypothetical protein
VLLLPERRDSPFEQGKVNGLGQTRCGFGSLKKRRVEFKAKSEQSLPLRQRKKFKECCGREM